MQVKMFLSCLVAILALGPVSSTEQPKCVKCLRTNTRVTKLDLPVPVNYTGAEYACLHLAGMLLLLLVTDLTPTEKSLCGDQLVPMRDATYIGWKTMMPFYDENLNEENNTYSLVVNVTTGRWHELNNSHVFSCLLCQHDDLKLPIIPQRKFQDSTVSEYFVLRLVTVETRETAEVGDEEETRIEWELYQQLRPSKVKLHRTWLDEAKHLHIEIRSHGSIFVPETRANGTSSFLNYELSVEDVDVCPAGETVDDDGVVTQWPAMASVDNFIIVNNVSTGAIMRRGCFFNRDAYRAEWHPLVTRWELVWENCSSDEQYINEERYKRFLDAVDIDSRHILTLQELASTPVNSTTLQEVARLVDRELTASNKLYEEIERRLVNITAHLVMDSGSDNCVAKTSRADLIVVDLGGSKPVVGFALEFNLTVRDDTDNITLNRKPTVPLEEQVSFTLDVSPRLAEAHTRMAIVVAWRLFSFYENVVVNYKMDKFIEVTVMFPRKGEVSRWAFASYSNHDVDIAYDFAMFEAADSGLNYIDCVAWSRDLQEWKMEGCKTLYTGNMSACRCSGKYFALQDGVPIAKYALMLDTVRVKDPFENDSLNFFKNNIALMTVTAIECLLSLLGLGSIIATAIRFKRWRENAGHKILLHMVLALTCNLVLGFIANFVHMITESVGCLIYGVLRHYSFLAMFLWMLVLSLLQLKRLMTVAGAKATTHLILKAAVFSWGLPLVPIIILLAINPRFYQSDRFDRGYCYPEGIVFQVTVQAPAGLILFVNLGIFIKIVMHICGCSGEKKITRHSKNEKAEQLNKLKTSLFIFFLFGFTWVFHIFSEERVIVSDFLFEYLFLMTATTHIFVLALFFVVFQESTRKEWTNTIKKMKKKK